jgi:hypothetical protein
MVEDMPTLDPIIHEHEELAEKLALVLYWVGIVPRGIFNIKNMVLHIRLVSGDRIGATQVGNSGGNIRHMEIREDTASNNHKSRCS